MKSNRRVLLGEKRFPQGRWTQQEDKLLKEEVLQNPTRDWGTISLKVGRSETQCKNRWETHLDPNIVKGAWKREEDNLLIELVKLYGSKEWNVIASHIPGRLGKQCRERWHNHLSPEVSKEPWTPQEDTIIMEMHYRFGNRWTDISEKLKGRPANAIKNHWNSTLKRQYEILLSKGFFTCLQAQLQAQLQAKASQGSPVGSPVGSPQASIASPANSYPNSPNISASGLAGSTSPSVFLLSTQCSVPTQAGDSSPLASPPISYSQPILAIDEVPVELGKEPTSIPTIPTIPSPTIPTFMSSSLVSCSPARSERDSNFNSVSFELQMREENSNSPIKENLFPPTFNEYSIDLSMIENRTTESPLPFPSISPVPSIIPASTLVSSTSFVNSVPLPTENLLLSTPPLPSFSPSKSKPEIEVRFAPESISFSETDWQRSISPAVFGSDIPEDLRFKSFVPVVPFVIPAPAPTYPTYPTPAIHSIPKTTATPLPAIPSSVFAQWRTH